MRLTDLRVLVGTPHNVPRTQTRPVTVADLIAVLQEEGLLTPLWHHGGLSRAFYEDDPDDHDGRYWLLEGIDRGTR